MLSVRARRRAGRGFDCCDEHSKSIVFRRAAASIAPRPWKADVPFYQAASPLALAIDAILIVATSLVAGFVYNRAAHGQWGDSEFAGTGVIVALLFCGVTRLQARRDKRASSTRLGRARMAAVAWVTTFLFLIVLAFSLKISATFSRGVVFSFFAAGLFVATISRTMTPRLLARWIRNNAFRGLEVLVIAPDGHPGTVTLCTELVEQGCTKFTALNLKMLAIQPRGLWSASGY